MENTKKPADAIQRPRVRTGSGKTGTLKRHWARYTGRRCMASLLRAATGTWCFLGCADGWLLQLLVLGAAVLVAP